MSKNLRKAIRVINSLDRGLHFDEYVYAISEIPLNPGDGISAIQHIKSICRD